MAGIENPAHGAVNTTSKNQLEDAKAALVRELLAESLAIGIDRAAKSLRHTLAADDGQALESLRDFLLATHSATDCARELQDLTRAGQRPLALHAVNGGRAHG